MRMRDLLGIAKFLVLAEKRKNRRKNRDMSLLRGGGQVHWRRADWLMACVRGTWVHVTQIVWRDDTIRCDVQYYFNVRSKIIGSHQPSL